MGIETILVLIARYGIPGAIELYETISSKYTTVTPEMIAELKEFGSRTADWYLEQARKKAGIVN